MLSRTCLYMTVSKGHRKLSSDDSSRMLPGTCFHDTSEIPPGTFADLHISAAHSKKNHTQTHQCAPLSLSFILYVHQLPHAKSLQLINRQFTLFISTTDYPLINSLYTSLRLSITLQHSLFIQHLSYCFCHSSFAHSLCAYSLHSSLAHLLLNDVFYSRCPLTSPSYSDYVYSIFIYPSISNILYCLSLYYCMSCTLRPLIFFARVLTLTILVKTMRPLLIFLRM